jgi:hypothetical protein
MSWIEMKEPLVPPDFAVPLELRTDLFVLEPLDVRHNESDYAAWTSSKDHIRATPGFTGGRTWLDLDMSLEDNADDLAVHAGEFADRTRFAYTVLDPATAEVIGCVYIGRSARDGCDADVRSWVRADRADLDKPLYDTVTRWLSESWPFQHPDYAPR